jgi:hypothetical protein
MMRAKGSKKSTVRAIGEATADEVQPTPDLLDISADVLRDKVYETLSALPREQSDLVRDKILSALRSAGVNIGASLLLLGIPATQPAELMPLELAKLLRYVRINLPDALKLVGEPLISLMTRGREPRKGRVTRKAA